MAVAITPQELRLIAQGRPRLRATLGDQANAPSYPEVVAAFEKHR